MESYGRVSFTDISFRVESDTGSRTILHGVSGSFERRRLTAVLGTSGAGKTSLFEILAGRLYTQPNLEVSGAVNIFGDYHEVGKGRPDYKVSYMTQNEILIPVQTVTEALAFSATMQLPDKTPEERTAKVNDVIEALRLQRVRNGYIGGDHFGVVRGLSGGERKRVAVGIDLVTDAPLFFLDEPTTGLDSDSAMTLVKTLRDVTRRGDHTVFMTLHQPSNEILAMLDRIILMSDGHILYCDEPSKLVGYFDKLGLPCPEGCDPTHHFLTLVSAKALRDDGQALDRMVEARRRPSMREKDIMSQLAPTSPPEERREQALGTQILWLLRREARIAIRHPMAFVASVGQLNMTVVLLCILFFDLSHTQKGIENRFNAIFMLIFASGNISVVGWVVLLPMRFAQVKRDFERGFYRASAFIFVETVVTVTCLLLCAIPAIILAPTLCNFNVSIPMMALFLFGTIFANFGMGSIAGVVAPDPDSALTFLVGVNFFNTVMGGFFVKDVPAWLNWMFYINPLWYLLKGMAIDEFHGATFHCTDDELQLYGTCPVTEGAQRLELMDIDDETANIWINLLWVYSFAVGYRIIAMLIFARRMTGKFLSI